MRVQNQYTKAERPWTERDAMQKLIDEELTQEEMAERFGCSQDTISRWLSRHGFDYQADRTGPRKTGATLTMHKPHEHSATNYERWRAWNRERGGNDYVYVHRLLAVAEYGFEAVRDKHIHHINGIGWDNRPDNIVPVDEKEHRRRYH